MQDSEFQRLIMNACSSNPMVRDDAICKLGNSGDQRAVPILIEIMNKSESALTKAEAMRAIANLTGGADPFSKGALNTQSNKASTKGDCFIATAAFGSSRCAEVNTLRAFRDQVLLRHRPGQWFVRLYYRIGPPLARQVRKHRFIRIGVMILLIPLAAACGTVFHLNDE